jgi:hypothetical protein
LPKLIEFLEQYFESFQAFVKCAAGCVMFELLQPFRYAIRPTFAQAPLL